MKFKLGRRAPLYLAVALIAGLMVGQPTLAAAEWQNPDRHLTVTDPDGGTLRPGDTVHAAISGFAPAADVQLAVCYDSLFQFSGAQPPADWACTPRTTVAVDPSGGAALSYQIPADLRVSLAGNCAIGLFSSFSPCSLVAFEGAPLVSVASTVVHFAQGGTASVSGRVVDDLAGTPLTSASVELCVNGGYDCLTADTTSGTYQFSALPAGTYSVRASDAAGAGMSFGAGMGEAMGSNTVGVVVADGQAVSVADVPVPALNMTTGPVGYPGATIAITPANPSWNDTVTISGGGFRPGHPVNVGLCSPVYISIQFGQLSTCPRTPVTADQSGSVTVAIPFTNARFREQCGVPNTCMAFAHETDLDGRGRWATLSFTPPTGKATISGNVSLGGAPLPSTVFVSVNACGPIGCTFLVPNESAFTSPAPADGDYTVTASAFVGGRSINGSTTVNVSGDQSVTGIEVELDAASLPTGAISGVVKDSTGDVIPGVTVSACKIDGGPCSGNVSVRADGQGQYRLPYLGDGTWRLSVTSSDFSYFPAFSQLVNVSGGAETAGVELALPVDLGTGSIVVDIVDVHGHPIDAYVSTCIGVDFGSGCRNATSVNGIATLKYLPDGTHSVQGSAGNTSASVSATVSGGGATHVTLTMPLAPGEGSIAGTVRDAGGDPVRFSSLSFCVVQLIGGCSASYYGSTQTDGTYLRPDLPDGTYEVIALGLNSNQLVKTTVELSVAADLTGVDLTIPADFGTGSIEGAVTDPNGIGIPSSVQACDGAVCFSQTMMSAGTYQIQNLPDGTFVVTARSFQNPFIVSTQGTVLVAGGKATKGIDFQLDISGPPPIDGTPPTITIARPVDGATYSRGDDIAADFSCSDVGGSGLKSCAGTVADGDRIDTSTLGTRTFTVEATDNAGNEASQQVGYVVVDSTAPSATASVSPEPNAAGWVASTATVTLEAADEEHGSGLASLSLGDLSATEAPLSSDVSTDGTTTLPYAATDHAGNVQSGTVTVNLDRTAPTASITAPAAAATVPQGAAVSASYECADPTSGIASCTGSVPNGSPIDTSTPGTKTLTVTATDNAGNTTTETRTLTVTGVTPPASGDHVSVRFSGAVTANYDDDLTGQVALTRVKGKITAATASGTVPGAAGGTATVEISVRRLWSTSLFLGRITVTDPGRRLSQSAPILGNVTASGSTVSGTSRWFTSKLASYTVNWAITDGG